MRKPMDGPHPGLVATPLPSSRTGEGLGVRALRIAACLLVLGVLAIAQEPRTIPCLIAKLHVADFVIDDQEIVIALDLWIAQSRVGPEIPQPISDDLMIRIIDLWVRGADCRQLRGASL